MIEWKEVAKEICAPGIKEKFHQNTNLRLLLLSTNNQTLVEASHDSVWGTGIPLQDEKVFRKMWMEKHGNLRRDPYGLAIILPNLWHWHFGSKHSPPMRTVVHDGPKHSRNRHDEPKPSMTNPIKHDTPKQNIIVSILFFHYHHNLHLEWKYRPPHPIHWLSTIKIRNDCYHILTYLLCINIHTSYP